MNPASPRISSFRLLRKSSVEEAPAERFPNAFTEQGVAMLSSVLRSARAVQANIAIMRTAVHLRALLVTHEDLRRKIEPTESRYEAKFSAVLATLTSRCWKCRFLKKKRTAFMLSQA